jgi:hypothetical protein
MLGSPSAAACAVAASTSSSAFWAELKACLELHLESLKLSPSAPGYRGQLVVADTILQNHLGPRRIQPIMRADGLYVCVSERERGRECVCVYVCA